MCPGGPRYGKKEDHMDDLKRALAACMEEYDREIRQAVSQLRPGDGFMGLGRDPRREPWPPPVL